MKKTLLSSAFLALLLLVILFVTGCPNGDKMADEIFKKNGMNRLRVITTRVKTSGIILVKSDHVNYIGEIADFSGDTPPLFTTAEDDAVIQATNANSSAGGSLVLKKASGNSTVANNNPAGNGLDLLNSFLPVSAEGKIQFSGDVQISQISAKDQSLKVSEINSFISSPGKSRTFLAEMKKFADNGYKVYLVYEVFKSNKLTIKTASGSQIGANVNVNQIIDAGAGFSMNKNSNSSLIVDGSTYYTFAVRSLKLSYKNGIWRIEPGTFNGTGLGSGDDKSYSYAPLAENQKDFATLDVDYSVPKLP